MPTPDQLPPELHQAYDDGSASDRAATRFFTSSGLHRVVAWVVIGAMFLVPLGISLLNLLAG